MTTLQTQQLTELRHILAEYEPRCGCNFPEDGEDGIIYCLACAIRDRLGLGSTREHAASVRAMGAPHA